MDRMRFSAASPDNRTVYLYLYGREQQPTLLGNPPDPIGAALIDQN